MKTTPTGARFRFGLAWLLLAAALIMRAVVPQGYMAEAAPDGTIVVALCQSDAVLTIPLKRQQHDEEPPQGREQAPCAFASLAIGDGPGPDAPVLSLPDRVAEQFDASEVAFALAAAARQLPPARAPPAKA